MSDPLHSAGAIWANTMPSNLAKYLPSLSDSERSKLYGNISSVLDIPRGDPVREGVIEGSFVGHFSSLVIEVNRVCVQRTMIL